MSPPTWPGPTSCSASSSPQSSRPPSWSRSPPRRGPGRPGNRKGRRTLHYSLSSGGLRSVVPENELFTVVGAYDAGLLELTVPLVLPDGGLERTETERSAL